MKAPKFVFETDHKAGYNSEDKRKRLEANNLLDAISETYSETKMDDNIYCTTIFQLIPKTNGKLYEPILRSFGNRGFYPRNAVTIDTAFKLEREVIKGVSGGLEMFFVRFIEDDE